MFRITKIATEDGTVLRLAGHLLARDVAELERICREVGRPLRLDLSDLTNADASALAAILELAARGAELIKVPPFTALLLKSEDPRGSGG